MTCLNANTTRKIRSFVRRSGRLTPSQQKGLGVLSENYMLVAEGVLNFPDVFANDNAVVLEIGFGNGDSLLQMARTTPDYNFLGIEVYEAGIGRLISHADKQQLSNLKVINGDAIEILNANIGNHSLHHFQLFFPDPWHKKKHHKRRLVQANFLDLIANKLINGATVHMATDWQHYAVQMMNVLESHPHFKNTMGAHNYCIRPKHRPVTKFEKRGKQLGHVVWDLMFTCEK